jgi:predicted DNA-binding mobile mystery protein A
MKNSKQQLILEQLDRKLSSLNALNQQLVSKKGWIHTIRTAVNMSLRQLGNRLNISAQGLRGLENREMEGTITINSLKEVANALDMKLVYGFVPKDKSVKNMIEKQARKKAEEIVLRTSKTMALEDQKNSDTRIKNAIKDKTDEIKTYLPKYLWE